MSVQRIDSRNTHGWQARAHVAPGVRLTKFFADGAHGGKRRARQLAKLHEAALYELARTLKPSLPHYHVRKR